MDPGPQPAALTSLSQIEEILIARVNPMMQVTHAPGGQYKYSGHTICFPQDITKIANIFPRRVEHLDILIVTHHSNDHKAYDFNVSRHRSLTALEYKLENDPYYKNVRIDTNALASLPTIPTDVSSSLHHSNTSETVVRLPLEPPNELTEDFTDPLVDQTSSFIPIIPNTNTEIQEIAIIFMLTTTNLILELSGQQLVYHQSMNTTQKVYSLWLSSPFSRQALQFQISQG